MIELLKNFPVIIQRILVATIFGLVSLLLLVYSLNYFFIAFIAFVIIFFEYSYVLTQRKFSNLFVLLVLFAGLRLVNFFTTACCAALRKIFILGKRNKKFSSHS